MTIPPRSIRRPRRSPSHRRISPTPCARSCGRRARTRRGAITGVLIAAEDDGVRMVATDSYRLAVRDLPETGMLSGGQKVLVPHRALTELQRILGASDQLTVRLGARHATFECGRRG